MFSKTKKHSKKTIKHLKSTFSLFFRMIKKKVGHFFRNTRSVSYIVDAFLLSSILLVFSFEIKGCISINIFGTVTTHIIVSLVPAIITIIFVIIQLQNETIRGIKLRDFERLRKGFYFHLLHMAFIVLAIFLLEVSFQIFDKQFSILILDLIALIYSSVFLIQEIPVLTRYDKKIDSILNKIRKYEKFTDQDEDSPGQKAILFTLLTFGIQESVHKFSKPKKKNLAEELINSFLSREIGFYDKIEKLCSDNREYLLNSFEESYGLNLLEIIDISFADISFLLLDAEGLKYGISGDGSIDIIHLTRLSFRLKKILESLGYSDKAKDHISSLVNFSNYRLYGNDVDKYTQIYQYLLLLATHTVLEGDTWFIKIIRDVNMSPYFYEPDKSPLEFLLTMFFCFYLNSSLVDEDNKEKLQSFLESRSEGINSGGFVWLKKIGSSLENLNSSRVFLSGVIKMFKLKHMINDAYFEIRPKNGGVYSIDDSSSFSDGLFFNYVIEILMSNYFYDLDDNIFGEFMEKLGKDSKTFLNAFEIGWVNAQSINYQKSFYQFIFKKRPEYNYFESNVYAVITNYHQAKTKEEYDKDKTNFVSDSDIKKIKKLIDKQMDMITNEMMFTDRKLESNSSKKYFSFLIGNGKNLDLVNLYLSSLKNSFSQIVNNYLKSKIDAMPIDDYHFADIVKDVINFDPDYCGSSKMLYDDLFDAELGSKIKRITNGMLPRDMFIKKGGLKINFTYHPDLSIPRRLTRDEIETIIDRDYTMVNGFYRYNKNEGSSVGNFLVTREQLSEYLIKKMVYIPIVFSESIYLDKTKIRYYKHVAD